MPMARVLCPLPDRDFNPHRGRCSVAHAHARRARRDLRDRARCGARVRPAPRSRRHVRRARREARAEGLYAEMVASKELRMPIKWAAIDPNAYDALLLPGGHARA